MSFDLIIPFLVLIALVIYFMYTRAKFEKEIVKLYEKKFEEWKIQSANTNKSNHKELIGLVFEQEYKLSIELIDKSARDRLIKGKFEIKE